MARKNIEVTVVGGLSSRVPSAPKVETPVAPAPKVAPETKQSRRGSRNG